MPVERPPGVATTTAAAPKMSARHQQNPVRAGRIAAQPDTPIGDLVDININGKVLKGEWKPGKRWWDIIWGGGIIHSARSRPAAAQIAPLGRCTRVKIVSKNGLRANARHQNYGRNCNTEFSS